MKKRILSSMLLLLLACNNDCPNCEILSAKNSSYSFNLDKDFWEIYEATFSEIGEYNLQHSISSLKINILSSRNEYLSTSLVTKKVKSNVANFHPNSSFEVGGKIKLKENNFAIYNYVTSDFKEEKLLNRYYEFVEPNESVGFIVSYRQNDKVAQNFNTDELVKKILIRTK